MERHGLEALIEPELESLGFECVKLEIVGATRNPIVRIYIDKPGGVTIRDCSLVSRAVGLVLDEADPLPGRYLLEVSSPGNNRPLAKQEHFSRFGGESARVQFKTAQGEKKTYTGIIQSCIHDVLMLKTEDGMLSINVCDIIRAHLAGVEYKIDKKTKHARKKRGGTE
jgi:ribosome maturation factor RimP